MAILSSIFSCCEPNRKAIEAEAETRRARIRSVYNHSRNASLASLANNTYTAPPPKYSDIAHDSSPIVYTDDKDPNLYQSPAPQEQEPQQQQQDQERSSSPIPSISDQTSIISVPSTRLSGITSTYTGNSVRARIRARRNQRDLETGKESNRSSWRGSIIYTEFSDSPPPSYYTESDAGRDTDADDDDTRSNNI